MESIQAESAGQLEVVKAGSEQRLREIVLLLILASVQFTSIVDFMVVMPLGPQLMRRFAIDPEQFGRIVASYTIAAGLAGLLGSSIMDRFSRKAAFLTLYSGFLLGTLLCGLSRSYWTLLFARVLTGAFGGILSGLALAIVADVFPEERRGRATGVLMSAFAVASAFGVPVGLYLGTKFGWYVPFLILAALGLPVLFAGIRFLPSLRDHLHHASHSHPLRQIVDTFRRPNNLRAFALTIAVMLGSFSVIPYISLSLVMNAGVAETQLPWVFVTGGLLTLVGAPLVGRLADHFGKLLVYRVVATISMGLMLAVTNLPRVPLALAIAVVATLMLSNAGRMVAALTMITGSVERRLRGGFMSANSAVQHLASGVGASIGGRILVKSTDGTLENFNKVGLLAVTATLISLWLAGLLRPAPAEGQTSRELAADSTGVDEENAPDIRADKIDAQPR
jgi:predicted MFS family arabinose efflux permease